MGSGDREGAGTECVAGLVIPAGAWDTGIVHRILLCACLLCVLLLAGCPLSSDQPLSDPGEARIDTGLVGAWTMKDPDTGEQRVFIFLAFNDHELVGFTPADPGPGEDAFRVFTTVIGAETFLNVQELGTNDTGWSLLHYRIDGTRLVLTLVDDGLFGDRSFGSPAELRAFVQANLADPRLYASEGEERQDMILERATK